VLIDLKYHLISLVAVFLALAVGMLMGSSFIAGTSVKGLEQQFARLRTENRQQRDVIESLRNQGAKQMEFGRAVAPMLVDSRLAMQRVAIIQTGDYSEATQSAKSILEQAGASVSSVTTLSYLDSPAAEKRISEAIEEITGEVETGDLVGRMLGILANCVATGSNREVLQVFEKHDLLTLAGDYEHRASRVVLVGGSRRRENIQSERADLALIDKLHEAGVVTIVGTEPADAVSSYIPIYHSKSIPTVDNIDQPTGQVALVYAVAGETGNFGIKKSADRVVPSSLGSGQWRGASVQ